MSSIKIPKFANIKHYRTMTKEKKNLAIVIIGKNKPSQKDQTKFLAIEEGINKEKNKTKKSRREAAVAKKARFNVLRIYRNKDEIFDEAIGLIRTAQQFNDSKRVMAWWYKVKNDVKKILSNKKEYNRAFREWKKKKTLKSQAKGVTAKA